MLQWRYCTFVNIGQWTSLILCQIQINSFRLCVRIFNISKFSFLYIPVFNVYCTLFYQLRSSLYWRVNGLFLFPLLFIWDSSFRRYLLASLFWLALHVSSVNFSLLFSNILIPVRDHVMKICIVLSVRISGKSVQLLRITRYLMIIALNFWVDLDCDFCCFSPIYYEITQNCNLLINSS